MASSTIMRTVGIWRPTVCSVKQRLNEGKGLDKRWLKACYGCQEQCQIGFSQVDAATCQGHQGLSDDSQQSGQKGGWEVLGDVEKAPCHQSIWTIAKDSLKNGLKSEPARQVIIFSNKKTWTVNPVQNCPNDYFVTFGGPKWGNISTMTKHTASSLLLLTG